MPPVLDFKTMDTRLEANQSNDKTVKYKDHDVNAADNKELIRRLQKEEKIGKLLSETQLE